jgi:nucleotide-binding universal stress UspA family protein
MADPVARPARDGNLARGTPTAVPKRMSIIAAVDLTPASVNAARSAALLARLLGEKLVLVRAIEPVSAFYPELVLAGAPDLDEAVRRGANEALANIALMLEDLAPGLEIETLVRAGIPHEVISEAGRAEKARLIVVGTRGRGRGGRLFLGSVARRTLRAAPCPVLVLREGMAPFADWVAGKRALRLVVGVDRSRATEAAVAFVAGLRKTRPCDVILLHEYWPPAEQARLGLGVAADPRRVDDEVVSVLGRELREVAAELPPLPNAGTVTTRLHAGWNTAGVELALDAEAAGADLLIVGSEQPHGLARLRGSDALAALESCRLPLLVVPAQTRPGPAPGEAPIPLIRAVLVATDLSELGNSAVPHAYALARRAGARVEICHVHERPTPIADVAFAPPGMTVRERQELEDRLMALVPREANDLGITSHATVIDGGAPAEQIVSAAFRLGVDAIVLASHGRSGIGRALFGSVAEAILRRSDLPVYVVRPRDAG